jgi:predicted dehydrogenase
MVRNYTYDDTVRIFTDIGGMPTDLKPKIFKGDGGHTQVIRRFVNAILHGGPPTPTPAEGLRRAEVLDACYRSAAAGREVLIAGD